LLAYGLWFLIAGRQTLSVTRSMPEHRLGFAVASALTIAAIYLPWLPSMLTRYRVDRSYWQGALKLGEALRQVAISFTSGSPETMLEGDAVGLLPWFGLALVVSVIAMAASRTGRVGTTAPGAAETAAKVDESRDHENPGLRPLWYLLWCLYRSSVCSWSLVRRSSTPAI
jgi:hypothetical protein